MPVKENLLSSLQIKKIPPPLDLKPYINSYFLYDGEEIPQDSFFRALPNGKVEMFFLFSGSRIIFQDKWHKQRLSGFLSGIFEFDYPMRIKIETNGKRFRGISVLFTHLGVNQLLGINLYEITNKVVGLDSSRYPEIYRQYVKLSEIEKEKFMFENLNDFFLDQLRIKENQPQKIIAVLNYLEHMTGLLSVERLADKLQISYKSLYRMFTDEMGISPKRYLKIVRFNRACYLLDGASKMDRSEIVYECGYYDQSHLLREFKSIMKESPNHYLYSGKGRFYFNRPYALK